MEDEMVNQETSTPEVEQDTTPENENYDVPTVDDYNKVKSIAENQKIRAEKAEKELKELKSKQTLEKETPKNDEPKSNETDYTDKIDKLTLKSEGITHPDDQKIVLDEAKRLKLPVDEVIGMEHIKSKLRDLKDQREAQDGSPKGKGKAGGTGQHDVDYYLAKGTTPDDLELANKVIEARMRQETNSNKFSDELYTG